MIIVSQDKETVLNFDNIQNIRIEEYGTHVKGKKTYKIFAGNFEGYATKLGTYAIKERAKEVLQEIYKVYSDFTLIKYVNEEYQDQLIISNKNKYFDIYEMPED